MKTPVFYTLRLMQPAFVFIVRHYIILLLIYTGVIAQRNSLAAPL